MAAATTSSLFDSWAPTAGINKHREIRIAIPPEKENMAFIKLPSLYPN
jgi:hypothetical protein